MQAQGFEVSGLPIGTGSFIVRQANDIPTLAAEMARAMNAYVVAHPNAILFDIDLAGGGAGNVFLAQVLMLQNGGEGTRPGDLFANQHIAWFFGSDAHTLQVKENAYLATLASNLSLWAWSASCAGDGAIWGKVLVTWNPTLIPGPG